MNYIAAIAFLTIFLSQINMLYAAEDRQPKTVRGKVLLSNGLVAEGAEVTITCKSHTLTDTTSRFGNYEVTFANLECEQFDTAYVSVVLDELSGFGTKEVQYFNGVNMSDIILSEETDTSPTPTDDVPVSVPEFGSVSAIMAGSVSLLAYARLRRTNV